MKSSLAMVLVALVACGSKESNSDKPASGGSAAPAAPSGGSKCDALLPENVRTGHMVRTVAGGEHELTCKVYEGNRIDRGVTVDCKPGQTLDAFKTAHAQEEPQPDVGRAATKHGMTIDFFATNADCSVSVRSETDAAAALELAKAVDPALKTAI
jgi:hypothetical protein